MRGGRALVPAVVVAFTGALLVYFLGAAPTVLYGDSAELQSVALLGGVAHPTGYPTFILLGRLFGHLGFSDPAFRITFMSGCFGAAAVALVVVVLNELGLSPRAAFAGAVIYGTTFTFWTSALRAEVYTLAMTLFLIALWRTLVALRSGRLRELLGAGFCLGLTLTGHLSYAPPVAALGIALAWRVASGGQQVVRSLALLLGAFLLGLTPYLYLVWADTQRYAFDYLRLVDQASNPLGLHDATFDTPWKRVAWLILGRNELPVKPFVFDPRGTAIRLLAAAATVFLFELGPLALPLALAGFRRQLVDARGAALLLAALVPLSTLFSALVGVGRILPVFLMPCVLCVALFTAKGLEPVLDRVGRAARIGPRMAVVLGALAAILVTLPAHAIRLYAYDHPVGHWKFRVEEEDAHHMGHLVPTMRGFHEPRRYGEQALAVIPHGALVVGEFGPLAILLYLHGVEARRLDLSFQPYSPKLFMALGRWQEEHDPRREPFVFLGDVPRLEPRLGPLDTVAAGDGWVYIQRTPLRGAP